MDNMSMPTNQNAGITYSVSASGLSTLIGVFLIGPLVWGGITALSFIVAKMKKRMDDLGEPSAQLSNISNALAETTSNRNQVSDSGREVQSTTDYRLTLLGYAIGIGNVWRFPYVIAQNGGGAALLAYLLSLVFVAFPLFVMESILGQDTRLSTMQCYQSVRPRWLGLGVAQAVMLFAVLSYYQILIVYAVVYTAGSVLDPLPWSMEAFKEDDRDDTMSGISAAERFWQETVLNQYTEAEGGLEGKGLGSIDWKLAVGLLGVWFVCFMAVGFGKRVLAKVTWVTVVGPILLMAILVVRALTLDGAFDGIDFYIGKFDASQLANLDVWATMLSQIIFSLSPGFGTGITTASFTKRGENVVRTALMVSVCNSAFSLVGGFAIFGIIGNVALVTNTTVEDVASRSGTGLAFISLASGITYFGEAANVMAVLFFVMLITLGLDSSFAWIETLTAYVEDAIQARGWKPRPKWKVVMLISLVMFLMGLPFCTRMGNELLDVVDHFLGAVFLLFGVAMEALLFQIDYGGYRRAAKFVALETNSKARLVPSIYWRFCLMFVAPLATAFLCGYFMHQDITGNGYGGYPPSLQALGWSLLVLCIALSLWTIWKREPGNLKAIDSHKPPAGQTDSAPQSVASLSGVVVDANIQMTTNSTDCE